MTFKSGIDMQMVRNKLYDEFIKPTTINDKKNLIGIEIEIPIVNWDKEAVDFDVVHDVTNQFNNYYDDFQKEGIDYDGNIFSMKNKKTGDIFCYDCSYNNIEFAMAPEKDLFTINDRFCDYYSFTKDAFEEHNHTLTGMGINPYREYNLEEPIHSERYLMLYHHLKSYNKYDNPLMHFHKYPAYGMFSSASQVQLDVTSDELPKTINVFSKLEPIKALLFSNSVLYNENSDITCYRDALWEYSTHGINPHNIGMYDVDFKDINDLESYLESLNIYCVMRDGAYINFPSMSLQEYFQKESVKGEIYTPCGYKEIEIKPCLNDVKYIRAFKFINLTFRGTVEFRSVCTQPIRDTMSVAAFHLGLKNRLDELEQLINNDEVIYHKGYTANELRKLFIRRELPSFVNKKDLSDLSIEILDLAVDGLRDRGIGEEKFLNPLYDRVKRHTNPGKKLLESVDDEIPLEELIIDYGNLAVGDGK